MPSGKYAVAAAIRDLLVKLHIRTFYLKNLTFGGCMVSGENVSSNGSMHIERMNIRPLISAREILNLSLNLLAHYGK